MKPALRDDLDVNITTSSNADTTSFTVPAGFLVASTEYEIGLAAEAPNGNLNVILICDGTR